MAEETNGDLEERMKMKPAIAMAIDIDIPFLRMIRMISGAGFETIALSSSKEYSEYPKASGRDRIRIVIEENGLEIDSIHAPYQLDISSLDESERKKAVRECEICIDAASELGIKIMVVHPGYGDADEGKMDRMVDMVLKSMDLLSRHALDRGVKLAVENLEARSRVLLERILESLPEDHIGLCYDTGHENEIGESFQILQKFGHRLFTTHIHDNFGIQDDHLLPYEGNIDWDRFVVLLRQIRYSGNLLLEVKMDSSQFKEHKVFLREAKKRADKLRSMTG